MGTRAPSPRAVGSGHSPTGPSRPSWLRGGGPVSPCPWSCWEEVGGLGSGPLDGTRSAAQPRGPTRASRVSAPGPLHGQVVMTPPAHVIPRGSLVSPPNHGSACATSVSLPAAHIAFSRATAGGAHTVGSPCSLQGPGAEGSWRRASSFHPSKTRACTHACTHPNEHTRVHMPVHWHTRVLTDRLAHKWKQAPRRLQGPPPSARPPVPWPPLVRGSAAAVSSPWRDLQPPAHRAHGACRRAHRALKRGIDRETEAGLKPSAPLSSCFSLAQGC